MQLGVGSDARPGVRLLGQPVLAHASGAVTALTSREAILLALLAHHAPRAVSRADIVDALYGDEPPVSARNAVQVAVSGLRGRLGHDALVTVGDGYGLTAGADVDVIRVAEVLRAGVDGDDIVRLRGRVAEALAEWRGPVLTGVRQTPFVTAEVARLEEVRLALIARRAALDLAAGRPDLAVDDLTIHVSDHPLHEGLRALLVRALHRCGRTADALVLFDSGRRLLRDMLGTDPSNVLQDAHREALGVTAAGRDDGVRPRDVPLAPLPLPVLVDHTAGRHQARRELQALLTTAAGRLVTLLGPGGIGKSRLAALVAHDLAPVLADGAAFVHLGQVVTAAEVLPAIADGLGLGAAMPPVGSPERAGWLSQVLAGRELLLVCDQAEHVDGIGAILGAVRDRAPGVLLLVTSRRPVGVAGEHRMQLGPLAHPGTVAAHRTGAVTPAEELFLARARQLDPELQLDAAGRAAVSRIVSACDGIPLAIELAAARTGLRSVHEVAAELADGDDDAVPGPFAATAVEVSVRRSLDTLPRVPREVLQHLASVRGGADIATTVSMVGRPAAQVETALQTLLDHGLVQRRQDVHGRTWLHVLEVVRHQVVLQYGFHGGVSSTLRHGTIPPRTTEGLVTDVP